VQASILLNNVSSIYLGEQKYEKVLYLSLACVADLETIVKVISMR